MKQHRIGVIVPILALVTAALSVGCTWTINIAVYRIWTLIPAEAFGQYQDSHAIHFVPLAVLIGLSSIVFAALLAWRGFADIPRTWLWSVVALAILPWVATPLYFIPLQAQLHAAGPTPELVSQLVNADLVLRALSPTLQCGVLCWILIRSLSIVPTSNAM